MELKSFTLVIFSLSLLKGVYSRDLFNQDLYNDALDPERCQIHLQEMSVLEFIDSSARLPQSVMLGGTGDYGNYYQCLNINQEIQNDVIEGKYCFISLPLTQEIQLPWSYNLNNNSILGTNLRKLSGEEKGNHAKFMTLKDSVGVLTGWNDVKSRTNSPALSGLALSLAVCIPKTCTTKEALNLDTLNITFTEQFCRLPNDKVYSVGDYLAIVIFSIIGLLTLISTGYDLYQIFIIKKDPQEVSPLLRSGSLYTNMKRLFTFKDTPGAITCLDGVRAISILWIVVGHSFANSSFTFIINGLDVFEWAMSSSALWLITANLAVDTFFMMSGLLIVYTTANKMSQMSLVKNLHFFYLHRYLRMFPILAVCILYQATIFHHLADGPRWPIMEGTINGCRNWWWAALLYVQNYVSATDGCLGQTWYLSVDMQLHVISPIILFWALGSKRVGWMGVTAGFLISVTAALIYCFIHNFETYSFMEQTEETLHYFEKYYVNTLTRAPAFFMGMVIGYTLHFFRDRRIKLTKMYVALGWIIAAGLAGSMVYINFPGADLSRFFLNLFNGIMRPIWALSLGWLVFACAHGYGGPINWFLSLTVFKFLARISFAVYVSHYAIISMLRASAMVPIHFTVGNMMVLFYSDLVQVVFISILLCVVIDAPFTVLLKFLLGGDLKSRNKPKNLNENNDVLTMGENKRIVE